MNKQETLEEAQNQQFKYDNLHDTKEISSCIKVVETLEEAAEKYDENNTNDEYGKSYRAFIEGAKWQQERSYSEEDMKKMYKAGYQRGLRGLPIQDIIEVPSKEWFEQFKKK